MIRWLVDTSRALLRLNSYLVERDLLRAELEQAVAARRAAEAQAARAHAAALVVTVEAVALGQQAQQHAAGCRAVLGLLIEPGRVEQCTKVRLRDEDEARAFGEHVHADTGVEVEPHKCRFCPRQPVSLEPFWHITHADPAKRGQHGKADPPQPAKLLRHVTPADVHRMRQRTAGEAP